jgi:hypothetical protein
MKGASSQRARWCVRRGGRQGEVARGRCSGGVIVGVRAPVPAAMGRAASAHARAHIGGDMLHERDGGGGWRAGRGLAAADGWWGREGEERESGT